MQISVKVVDCNAELLCIVLTGHYRKNSPQRVDAMRSDAKQSYIYNRQCH